jgi:hypothetical protein
MMRFHYVRYCTLSDVRDYWRNKADGDAQKMVAVHRSLCAPTPLILILILKLRLNILILYTFLTFCGNGLHFLFAVTVRTVYSLNLYHIQRGGLGRTQIKGICIGWR